MTARQDRLLYDLYSRFDKNPPPALIEIKSQAKGFVPGDGSLRPRVILVGEAPGSAEDRAGSPFVGPSGKLLDVLLEGSSLSREQVWITNVVKYRPKHNRTPEPDEIAASIPLLRRELAIVAGDHCRAIVGLGSVACSAMGRASISVGRDHGTWRSLRRGWSMFVSYHPSAGLRNRNVRDSMLLDFLRLGVDLGLQRPGDEPVRKVLDTGGPGNYAGRKDRFN